jgi:energy-coupling factor transporter ATP-binding protein EcfA2
MGVIEMRKRMKFYEKNPNILWSIPWALIGEFRKFWDSRKFSAVLRETFENAGLTIKKKVEVPDWSKGGTKVEERVIYPDVKVEADEHNFYFDIRMLPGHTRKVWEGKVDAIAQALFGKVVKSDIGEGFVKLVVQYKKYDVSKVLYKDDLDPYIWIGYGDSELIKWKFNSDPHLLLVGTTGSGKSTFVRQLIVQFPEEWDLRICDGKYVEFTSLERLGFPVATSKEQFVQFVSDARKEVDRRFHMLRQEGKNEYTQLGFEPVFLLIDEFIFLIEELSTKKEDGKTEKDRVFADLRDIALRGRAAGVFLILVFQRPDANYLPTVIRDNMMCKVVLKGSKTAFEMAFGDEGKGLEPLEMGQGYVRLSGHPEVFSFPNYELEQFKKDMIERRGMEIKEVERETPEGVFEPESP